MGLFPLLQAQEVPKKDRSRKRLKRFETKRLSERLALGTSSIGDCTGKSPEKSRKQKVKS